MEDISIRPYHEGDEEHIIPLLDLVFDRWPHLDIQEKNPSYSYWNWKYKKNPYKKNYITIAECGDEIVGCFHSIPMKIKIGENTYFASNGTDLAVHPEYRRRGIYGKMLALQNELEKGQINFHFGVSNNPIVYDEDKWGLGHFSQKTYVHVLINDIKLHEEKTQEIPFIKKYGYAFLKKIPIRKKQLPSGINVQQVETFENSINQFYEKIKPFYSFLIQRDHEYLTWRYCDKAGGSFSILVAEEAGTTVGYCVLRVNRFDPSYPVGYVVDLITLPGRDDVALTLSQNAVLFFDDADVNLIRWQITDKHPLEKVAYQSGFLNSKEINHCNYLREILNIGTDENLLLSSKPEKIHFVYGDYDWV